MAPQVGLEPTTLRLTAECSAIELLRNMESGSDLLSRAVSSQVPSALKGLTSVFGMGTGVTPSLSPPERVNEVCAVPKSSWFLSRYSVTEQSSFSSSVQPLPPPVSLSLDSGSAIPPDSVQSDCASAISGAPHSDNCTACFFLIQFLTFLLSLFFQSVSLSSLKSSPRPISIIKLHPLPHFHR